MLIRRIAIALTYVVLLFLPAVIYFETDLSNKNSILVLLVIYLIAGVALFPTAFRHWRE